MVNPVFFFFQWNSHGYDIAKMFGSKMTSVSPVWLQLRRRGPETFDVTGLHDHDPGRGPVSQVEAVFCALLTVLSSS